MKAGELGKFKPLIKNYNIKPADIEKIAEKTVDGFEVWVVEIQPSGSRRTWVYNSVNNNVFELTEPDYTSLMKVARWAKPKMKDK